LRVLAGYRYSSRHQQAQAGRGFLAPAFTGGGTESKFNRHHDLDANIEYVNTAFVKTTGYSLTEAVGQNPHLLHSADAKATYDDMWAHLNRGEVWEGEFINRRKDGSDTSSRC